MQNKFIGSTSSRLQKQMGRWAFIRYCKNLGMSFEETYFECFGRMPEVK